MRDIAFIPGGLAGPPSLPSGLVELMEGLSREVLRHNPENVYEFCAQHMQKLLKIRDGTHTRRPVLKLEEKIAIAQAKVRERAVKRRQEYDAEITKNIQVAKKEKEQDPTSNELEKPLENEELVIDNYGGVPNQSDINSEMRLVTPNVNDNFEETISLNSHNTGEKYLNGTLQESVVVLKSVSHEENNDVYLSEPNIESPSENNAVSDDEAETTVNQDDRDMNSDHETKVEEGVGSEVSPVVETSIAQNDSFPETSETIIPLVSDDLQDIPVSNIEEDPSILTFEKSDTFNLANQLEITVDNITGEHFIRDVNKENIINPEEMESISKSCDENDGQGIFRNALGTLDEISKKEIVEVAAIASGELDSIDSVNNQVTLVVETSSQENVENPEAQNLLEEIQSNSISHEENNENEISEMTIKNFDDNYKKDEVIDDAEILSEEPENKPNFEEGNATLVIRQNDETKDAILKSDLNSEDSDLKKDMKSNAIEIVTIEQNLINDEIRFAEALSNVEINTENHILDEEKSFDIYKTEVNRNTELNIETLVNAAEFSVTSSNIKNDVLIESGSNEDEPSAKANPDIMNDEIVKDNENSSALNSEAINAESIIDSLSENTNGTDEKNTYTQSSDMDLETAAITIQKVFRSFLFKNKGSTLDDISNEESLDASYLPEDIAGNVEAKNKDEREYLDRRAIGLTRMDTVLQTVNEEKSLSLSDDSSTLSSAATVIQAHVRGFLVRNRLHSHKTNSSNSLINSDGLSNSLEVDNEQNRNKTILNIHIVPEGGHYLSRDESMAMSVDLPFDASPPSSSNLQSLGYDITERRKLLKREDAIQSISPPSNNSGKSDDASMNEADNKVEQGEEYDNVNDETHGNKDRDLPSGDTTPTKSTTTIDTVIEVGKEDEGDAISKKRLTKINSDERDVVTPFLIGEESKSSVGSDDTSRLLHSGEFHDMVLPTQVSRTDGSVVRGE